MQLPRIMRKFAASPAFPVILAICVLLPPCVERGFSLADILHINAFILTHPVKPAFQAAFPLFNLAALAFLVAPYVLGEKAKRVFALFVSFTYLLSAFLQNISLSNEHGLGVSLSTLSLTIIVALAWLSEALDPENDFSRRSHRWLAWFMVPLAVLALWQPVNPSTMLPDWSPRNLVTSGSSLTFCMMTVVSMSVLLSFLPRINRTTLRVAGAVGLLIGVGNLWLEFIYLPRLYWVGVLHVPLVLISAVGLYASYKIDDRPAA